MATASGLTLDQSEFLTEQMGRLLRETASMSDEAERIAYIRDKTVSMYEAVRAMA